MITPATIRTEAERVFRRLIRTVQIDARQINNLPAGGGGAPDAHAASHASGGGDEINATGLTGVLTHQQVLARGLGA